MSVTHDKVYPPPLSEADLRGAIDLLLAQDRPELLHNFAAWWQVKRHGALLTPGIESADRALVQFAEGKASLSATEGRLKRWLRGGTLEVVA
jgi:hypothetical protein